jgi:hypothetical protein
MKCNYILLPQMSRIRFIYIDYRGKGLLRQSRTAG